MAKETQTSEERKIRSDLATGRHRADLSLIISILALLASGLTAWTARDALRFNKQAQADAQKTAIFAQFQQQYLSINSQFPAQLANPDFRPVRDSGDYDRLEAYWLFCYSEWYATHRVNPDLFGDLWSDYYAPLVGDALDIASLRYVFEDMAATRALDRGEWGPFLAEVSRVASEEGHPLRPQLQRRLAPYSKRGS